MQLRGPARHTVQGPATTHRGGRSIADTAHPEQSALDEAAVRAARAALELTERDPDAAERLLAPLLDDPDAHPLARAIAARGRGRLLTARGEMAKADAVFAAGLRDATADGLTVEAALLRMSWAIARQAAGDLDGALALLDAAERELAGGELGLVISQRGYVQWMQGHPQLALDAYDRALPLLTDAGDAHAVVRVLGNRGVAHAQVGAWPAARADFEAQLDLARRHERTQLAAVALHNLGWLEGRLGKLPRALELLSRARDEYVRAGAAERLIAALDTDHGELLLQAMLAPEADEIAARVVAEAERTGNALQVGEARLMRARSLLLMRRHEQSIAEAAAARAMFVAEARPAWAARADYVVEQARVSMPDGDVALTADDARRAVAIADALGEHGWFVESAEVRVHAGRTALAAGLHDLGREQLALAAGARERGTAAVRAEAWHAVALLRLAEGDPHGARLAIASGLEALDRHRATLGAIELRAHASAHGVELGRLAVRLALEAGEPADVLAWAERWRAGALAVPAMAGSVASVAAPAGLSAAATVTPDADPVGAAAPAASAAAAAGAAGGSAPDDGLATLRELHHAAAVAAAAGAPDPSLPARIAEAERAVTARARAAAGAIGGVDGSSSGGPGTPGVDVGELRRRLGPRTLVEFVELDGELHAIVLDGTPAAAAAPGAARTAAATTATTVSALAEPPATRPEAGPATTAGEPRLVPLGPTERVLLAHDHVVFALRRLSMLPPGHPALDAAAVALDTAAAEVDDLLIAPLGLGGGDLVVVPTGGLHRVAWSALPGTHDRAVTVAPSAAWWLGAGSSPPSASSSPLPSSSPAGPAGEIGRHPPGGPSPVPSEERVLLVEGPGLEGTAAELAAIGRLLPHAVRVVGTDATAARVLAEFGRADVAHVAAHGEFRGDNPMFSSLRVADGPIWVHDLAALARTPRLVVLTACEAGRSGVLAGDELLGTATALLSFGVHTVVAPLLPVPDLATARFAIRFHHHLAAGASPAQARARTAADERASGDPTGVAVAATFQCIGNRTS